MKKIMSKNFFFLILLLTGHRGLKKLNFEVIFIPKVKADKFVGHNTWKSAH